MAEGPKIRRAICRALPPEHQEHMLFVWEQAIDQTGGYFYSRLLLAVINGAGMFIDAGGFRRPVRGAARDLLGVVSEFIPIVGTYIGGAAPVLVAFLTSTGGRDRGDRATCDLPADRELLPEPAADREDDGRCTRRSRSRAALIGGAIGGMLFAFLALPAAGVIQAAMT